MDLAPLRLIILVLTVGVNSLLAVTVYKNSPKNATSRIFGALSLVTILWLVDVYLSVTPAFINYSLLWVRLSIFFGTLQIASFFLLAHTLPSPKLTMRPARLRILTYTALLVMIVAISPFGFTKVNIHGSDVQAVPGPGLALFMAFAVSLSIGAVYVLLKKLRQARGHEKEQYRYVVLGLSIMLSLLIGTVLIPVAFFGNSSFVPLIPLYTSAFLGLTTVAIVKHKLFDVRAVIARSAAYLLTVTAFVAIYTAAAIAISYLVFNDGQLNTTRHLTYIVLALVFTPTVYWLKRLFDKVTNRLFFQDAYDAQALLDELSNILVGNIELDKLLSSSSEVLINYLKLTGASFVLLEGHQPKLYHHSKAGLALDKDKLKPLLAEPKLKRHTVMLAHDLAGGNDEMETSLRNQNIAVIVRLSTHLAPIGYLFLGDKKSGNVFSVQDTKLLTIIAEELALAIQNSLHFEEIKNFNITLQEKIQAATLQLRQTNEKLKALDETKDEFISMASHQLRTPLTSVKGYLSMVLEGDAGKISANQRKLLDQAFISSQRMVYLIADLLNVSRLRTGKFVIEPVPTNLAEAVQGEVEQLVETAKGRGLELTYDKPKEFPTLMLDETKLRQVIMNFTDNAIYYTPSGGHIRVELKDVGESVEFTVTDDGIGVPKHEQHNLFNKFYRAGNARKARPDGTGLGLFMAKKVIIAQGGTLIFKTQEGKGSTFGFAFAKRKLLPPKSA